MARVIAVASAKGGVGKTTTTATLGTTLAAAGARVVAIDADLGMANLGDALGVEADKATLHDVLAGRADTEAATYEGPAGLTVVPGDTDLAAFPDADPSNLQQVLGEFIDYDYVLLDTGAGLSHDSVLPLGLADDVLLVTNLDPNAVGDTEKTRQVVGRLGGSVAGAVLTRVDSERLADGDIADLAPALDAEILAAIPSSPSVSESTASGTPVSVSAPTNAVAAAYRDLARELTGESIPEPDVVEPDPVDSDVRDVPDAPNEQESDDSVVAPDSQDRELDDETDDSEPVVEEPDEYTVADSEEQSAPDEDEDKDEDAVAVAPAASEDGDGEAPSAESDEAGAGTGVVDEDDNEDEHEHEDEDEDEAESVHEPTDNADETDDVVEEPVTDVDAGGADDADDTDADGTADIESDVDADADTDDNTADANTDDTDTDDDADVLVPDAEDGQPVDEVDSSPSDDGGVYETSLVEEAEANGAGDANGDDSETETDDDDDDGGSGFLSRLLG